MYRCMFTYIHICMNMYVHTYVIQSKLSILSMCVYVYIYKHTSIYIINVGHQYLHKWTKINEKKTKTNTYTSSGCATRCHLSLHRRVMPRSGPGEAFSGEGGRWSGGGWGWRCRGGEGGGGEGGAGDVRGVGMDTGTVKGDDEEIKGGRQVEYEVSLMLAAWVFFVVLPSGWACVLLCRTLLFFLLLCWIVMWGPCRHNWGA